MTTPPAAPATATDPAVLASAAPAALAALAAADPTATAALLAAVMIVVPMPTAVAFRYLCRPRQLASPQRLR